MVQPVAGDVLHLQLQQVIEMMGARRDAHALPDKPAGSTVGREPPSSSVGPRRNSVPTRITVMDFFARSTVEGRDQRGTVLSAVTDSLLVRSGEVGQPLTGQRATLPDNARPTRIRVAADGAMALLDVPDGGGSVGATLSAMPAMLPDGPVMVGDSWERDVEMPPLPPLAGYRAEGVLRTVFRLDSLTRGGRDAHISVRGTLHREGTMRDLTPGARVVTAGTMTGTLQLDRTRGWIVDGRTTIDVRSEVIAPADGGPPMQVGMRITQRLRVR